MHIPDGFLDAKTWVMLDVIAAGSLAVAISKANKEMDEKSIPLMGVTAAFIFAAQMVNFPIAGGTSGHLMGGVLAAVLLGPFAAVLVMATILIVQAFIFQDGGITALGANIFNMGVIGAVGGYYVYLWLHGMFTGTRGKFLSAFAAGWISIVLAASVTALELAVSGTVPVKVALPAMAGVHAVIGIGEGLITVAVLSLVTRVRPDLLEMKKV